MANTGGIFEMMIPMALVFGIFYVLVIRPQQKKVKEHQDRLLSLKKGDEVIVGGGFIGHVDRVDGEDLYVRMNQDVVMRCVKNTVTQVRGSAKTPAAINEVKAKAKPKAKPAAKTKKKEQ